MIDNGLLMHYPQLASKKGFLKTRSLDFKKMSTQVCDVAKLYFYKDSRYWFKYENKSEIASQVMLGQLYKQNGLNSAIYLPGLDGRNRRVSISNDIVSSHNMGGNKFFRKLYERYPKEVVDGELIKHDAQQRFLSSIATSGKEIRSHNIILDKLVTSPSLKDFSKAQDIDDFDFVSFFTKDGMRDFIKMHLFDTASMNIDRNSSNFYLEFDSAGKICGITTIDHSMSEESILYDLPESALYINFLGPNSEVSREEMLFELRENETVQHFMPRQEMAEILGNVNVGQVASDITDTIGYKFDNRFKNGLAKSFDDLANDLAK